MNYDVIVIGGGIVGAAAAYHLAKAGAKTLLVDRMDSGRATDAGAGILSPETSGLSLGTAWFDYAIAAVNYYTPLIAELKSDYGADTGYAVCGKLTVAIDDDEIDAYERGKTLIFERQKQRGLPSLEDLYTVPSAEAKALFPPLAAVQGAIYYRSAARVDGRKLSTAMRRAGLEKGLHIKQAGVQSIMVNDTGTVIGVRVDNDALLCGNIIIAGGAWSAVFGDQLGVTIPVVPQRGQIIHLHLPDADTDEWPVVTAFHGHYMLAWPEGRIVVGATREDSTGFAPHTTAAGIRDVLDEALRVAPGLAAAQFLEIRVGLRPATADHLPVLGTIAGVRGVYLATGMGASGLQLGPFSGKLAADWALDQSNTVDISAFNIGRF